MVFPITITMHCIINLYYIKEHKIDCIEEKQAIKIQGEAGKTTGSYCLQLAPGKAPAHKPPHEAYIKG